MSKLSTLKHEDASAPMADRIAAMVHTIIDDLDALAASVADEDAKGKISALADDYDNASHKIVADSILGSPALPPAEPPKPTVVPPATVSRESADVTAKEALDTRKHKRASGGKSAASSTSAASAADHNKAMKK